MMSGPCYSTCEQCPDGTVQTIEHSSFLNEIWANFGTTGCCEQLAELGLGTEGHHWSFIGPKIEADQSELCPCTTGNLQDVYINKHWTVSVRKVKVIAHDCG